MVQNEFTEEFIGEVIRSSAFPRTVRYVIKF